VVSNDISFPLDDYENNISHGVHAKADEAFTQLNDVIIANKRSCIFEVLNKSKVIFRFKSVTKASKYLNISRRTLTNYSKDNKL
jgi:hypothetical protein